MTFADWWLVFAAWLIPGSLMLIFLIGGLWALGAWIWVELLREGR